MALFLPRLALGHTLGLSVAEFDVAPEGPVAAHLTFASAEPLGATPLRDEDLQGFLARGVEVAADGARCDGTFLGASVTEADGLQLDARYACPRGAARLEVTLYYLSELGPGHREIARIVARGASIEGVLTGDRRALSLTLPGPPGARSLRDARARTGRRLEVLSAAFLAILLGLAGWRWRATRRP